MEEENESNLVETDETVYSKVCQKEYKDEDEITNCNGGVKKYNLSSHIAGKETLLISDFEGTTPTSHFAKFKEYCTAGGDKKVVFLGDVFDNTAQYGVNCKGDECDDPDDNGGKTCPANENYIALETIKLLVDNPDNCKYVFGNRDINKIKL